MRIRSLYKLLESYGKHAAYHFTRDIVLCSLFKAHRAINICCLLSIEFSCINHSTITGSTYFWNNQ
jgi:hypothetical protein